MTTNFRTAPCARESDHVWGPAVIEWHDGSIRTVVCGRCWLLSPKIPLPGEDGWEKWQVEAWEWEYEAARGVLSGLMNASSRKRWGVTYDVAAEALGDAKRRLEREA